MYISFDDLNFAHFQLVMIMRMYVWPSLYQEEMIETLCDATVSSKVKDNLRSFLLSTITKGLWLQGLTLGAFL